MPESTSSLTFCEESSDYAFPWLAAVSEGRLARSLRGSDSLLGCCGTWVA